MTCDQICEAYNEVLFPYVKNVKKIDIMPRITTSIAVKTYERSHKQKDKLNEAQCRYLLVKQINPVKLRPLSSISNKKRFRYMDRQPDIRNYRVAKHISVWEKIKINRTNELIK